MTKQKIKKRMYFHGECVIAEIKELPTGLKPRLDKDSIMIAVSETVGNEHRIKIKEGVEFFEDENGVLYMKNTVPTDVYCLHTDRHDTIELPVGLWKIDKALELEKAKFTRAEIDEIDRRGSQIGKISSYTKEDILEEFGYSEKQT